jgi:hypothetical protein
LEPGGGWDLSLIHLSFLCFVPLHTLLMFRPLAHTPYVLSPRYFLLQPSNAKGRTDLLVIPPTSLDANRGRGGMIFNEITFALGKML